VTLKAACKKREKKVGGQPCSAFLGRVLQHNETPQREPETDNQREGVATFKWKQGNAGYCGQNLWCKRGELHFPKENGPKEGSNGDNLIPIKIRPRKSDEKSSARGGLEFLGESQGEASLETGSPQFLAGGTKAAPGNIRQSLTSR